MTSMRSLVGAHARLQSLSTACVQQLTKCEAPPPSFTPTPYAHRFLHAAALSAPVSKGAMVLDGKAHAEAWQEHSRRETDFLKREHSITPGLAVILVGQRADSVLYVWRKRLACLQAGMNYYAVNLPIDVTQAEVNRHIQKFNQDQNTHGVLVQLPLPPHLSEDEISTQLDPQKDVDGFHALNMGRLAMRGRAPTFVPCTALGCLELLARSGLTVRGRHAVVLGNSNTVAIPISLLLRDHGAASVKIVHQAVQWPTSGPTFKPVFSGDTPFIFCRSTLADVTVSPEIPKLVRSADLVVVSLGVPKLVCREWVKPGAVVLDVGINPIAMNVDSSLEERCNPNPISRIADTGFQVVGDVDFEGVSEVASAVTPVPGGVGPMTVAALIHNVVYAAKLNSGLPLGDLAIHGNEGQKPL